MSERWEIPESWVWASLGDVSEVVGGGTPSTTIAANWGGEIPWITPADLSGYRAKRISGGSRSLTKLGYESSGAQLLPAGSVLFSSRAPIGHVAIAETGIATNQGFKSFVPEGGILSDYLYYYMQRARPLAIARGSGTTFLEISGKKAATIPIPLPPPTEQQVIVDAIDELLSDLDAGVAALERARAKLKHYRAAVLKAAVEGALTAEWREQHPDVEPASVLLDRILAERRTRWEEEQLRKFKEAGKTPPTGWKERYAAPMAPAVDSNNALLPKSWTRATVDQLIGEPLRNGHSAKVTTGAGVPTFSLSAVTENDFSEANLKVTSAVPARVADLWARADDIFVQRSNTPELVGTTARYTGADNVAIFPDLLIRIRVARPVSPAFVERCLQSPSGHAYFRSKAQGTSGSMPKIDQEIIGRCEIPLPPVAEQAATLELLDSQLSVIDHLESDIDAKLKSAQALRQSILRDAFEGKLVPQDPNDEPASELLKRIAAAREERARLAAAAKAVHAVKPKPPSKPPKPSKASKTTRRRTH